MNYDDILTFWFEELTPVQWWRKDEEVDDLIRQKFSDIHRQAAAGELSDWRQHAEGCLAEVIILDQFSRNMFRNSGQSYAYDSLALILSQEAIRRDMNQQLSTQQRAFLYLPFMHSESLFIHQQALVLFSEPGMEENYAFEKKHLDIIEQFGRYPHRNQALGRESTKEELAFLQHNSGF